MMELDQHHPVCAYLEASQFFFIAQLPLLCWAGDITLACRFIHTFYDRADKDAEKVFHRADPEGQDSTVMAPVPLPRKLFERPMSPD